MAGVVHVNEAGVETSFNTTNTIIGWRAHYADGRTYTSHSHTWNNLPSSRLILLMLIERGQFSPGQHFRTAIQTEWYGYDPDADTYYVIDQQGVSITEAQLRWPLAVAWKQGELVTDDVMNAAFDTDRPEWAV